MPPKPSHADRRSPTVITVIEVVVFLIAVAVLFFSVVLSAGTPTIRAAKRAKAANMANQIQTAVLNYYTEYGVYPVPAGVAKDFVLTDSDGAINAPAGSWGPLIECLSGMVRPSDGQPSHETIFTNTRQIAFLTIKVTDVSSSDQPLNPLPPNSTSLYFNIAIDADLDGLLGDPKSTSAGLLPSFATVTKGAPPPMTGSTKVGVAIWANCTSSDSNQNSNQWVHTY